MCLLNGDLGGSLPSSIDFGKIDTYNNTYTQINITDKTQYEANKYYIKDKDEYKISLDEFNEKEIYYQKDILLKQENLKIKDIIREALHTYGKEMYHNIIINDLEQYGLELLEYRGDKIFYLLYNEYTSSYDNIILNEDFIIDESKKLKIKDIKNYNNAIDKLNNNRDKFLIHDILYSVTKMDSMSTAGYRLTDLIYAGDLISSIGESLTSILDKIKNMLGSFEYFYDVDGRFVFQQKKIYQNISWNTIQDNDNNKFARDAVEGDKFSYSFENIDLIQQFQNTPSINNIKNDYSIWGVRKGVNGAEIPIHARYAIHKKPKYYKAYDGTFYCSDINMFDTIKENKKEQILEGLNDRISKFQLKYQTLGGLTSPKKNDNGSWTPGWWDIRDWHDYYYAIRQKEPKGTMKWYSKNSIEGCEKLSKVIPNKYNDNYDDYVWLIIYNPRNNTFNIQHGSGDPNNGYKRTCYYYESSINDEGKLITKKVSPEISKQFIYPFAGCADSHTYLEFLINDVQRQGNLVYFYNPDFPNSSSFEQVISDEIDNEFDEFIKNENIKFVDWREVIYQMAKDYYKYNQEYNFLHTISRNNHINIAGIEEDLYPTGITGYEMFYEDIQGFWRQLYDPNPNIVYDTEGGYYSEEKYFRSKELTQDDFNKNKYYIYDTELKKYIIAKKLIYQQCNSQSEFISSKIYYTKKDSGKYEKVEDLTIDTFNANKENYYYQINYYTLNKDLALNDTYSIQTIWNPFKEKDTFTCDYYLKGDTETSDYSAIKYYWNKNVLEAPETLNFWFDFYEGNDVLSQYAIYAIGDRPKVVNDNKITSIYFRKTPKIIFIDPKEFNGIDIKTGYTYIQLTNEMQNLFTISAQGKSAEEEVEALINQYSYCVENINISTIPIYYLQPNTLITIHNEDSKINGIYQINRLSIPLNYNGIMNITATKIENQIVGG